MKWTEALDIEALLAHRETVFLVCLGYVHNRRDAEELAQETYLRAWRALAKLREDGSVKAWLCSIARNACLDHLRRERHSLFAPLLPGTDPPDGTDLHAVIEEREQRATLRRAIERLPGLLREVLVLREYGELSYAQISEALGVTPGTVMSRLYRARTRVARAMRSEGGRR